MKNTWLIGLFAFSFVLASTVDTRSAAAPPADDNSALSPVSGTKESALIRSEQEKNADVLFREIFKLAQEGDRSANIPRMIELYQEIIDKCPEASLAHESYWRLIEINLRDFSPPRNDRALTLLAEFKSRYPDSPLMKVVQTTMARAFYLAGNWQDLLAVVGATGEEINAPKEFQQPLSIFYYSEAKFHLDDPAEAARGYQAIIKNFPDFQEKKIAHERLTAMEKGN